MQNAGILTSGTLIWTPFLPKLIFGNPSQKKVSKYAQAMPGAVKHIRQLRAVGVSYRIWIAFGIGFGLDLDSQGGFSKWILKDWILKGGFSTVDSQSSDSLESDFWASKSWEIKFGCLGNPRYPSKSGLGVKKS